MPDDKDDKQKPVPDPREEVRPQKIPAEAPRLPKGDLRKHIADEVRPQPILEGGDGS